MTDLYFLDTSILIYAVGVDPDEAEKRRIARRLIDADRGALSVQVLQEFAAQITRRSRRNPMTLPQAASFITRWKRMPVQENTVLLLDNAFNVHARHRYSFWDCLIVAAAQALGCGILYTEDMQDGRIIDGLHIVNPFREGAILP